MNVIINIENYEAFYLDFLEGNLNKEEMHALELFLNQYPELRIDNELPSFSKISEPTLEADFLKSMKMFDENERIAPENCEQFMIAEIEQILPEDKKSELRNFLEKNENLYTDYLIYQKTKLNPDVALVYDGKSKLKKGFIIPLYAKFAAIAASLTIVLMLIPNEKSFNNQLQSARKIKEKENYFNKLNQNKHFKTEQNEMQVNQISSVNQKDFGRISEQKTSEILIHNNSELTPIKPLKAALIPTIGSSEISQFKASNYISSTDLSDNANAIIASEMKNPIPLITREINSRFNSNLDIRSAKVSKKKQGGFYFKLGKFEISRKITPVQEELASF